jgi:hypothetical protein
MARRTRGVGPDRGGPRVPTPKFGQARSHGGCRTNAPINARRQIRVPAERERLAALVATTEHDLVAHGDPDRTRRLLVELVSVRYLPPGQPAGET